MIIYLGYLIIVLMIVTNISQIIKIYKNKSVDNTISIGSLFIGLFMYGITLYGQFICSPFLMTLGIIGVIINIIFILFYIRWN